MRFPCFGALLCLAACAPGDGASVDQASRGGAYVPGVGLDWERRAPAEMGLYAG